MTQKDIYGVLVRPLLTERSTILKEKHNQYLFETSPEATKTDIKLRGREAVQGRRSRTSAP